MRLAQFAIFWGFALATHVSQAQNPKNLDPTMPTQLNPSSGSQDTNNTVPEDQMDDRERARLNPKLKAKQNLPKELRAKKNKNQSN